MSVAQRSIRFRRSHFYSDLEWLRQWLRAAIRRPSEGLTGGWRAAIDYWQLSEMSDRQVKRQGLSRSDIPQCLHQRHFGSLAGWLDNID